MKEEIEAIIENNKVLALNATATLITHKSMLIFFFYLIGSLICLKNLDTLKTKTNQIN